MELVIANIALANGFIGQKLFSMLVLIGTVTTFVTPILPKKAYHRMALTPEPKGSDQR